jgi:hypothetical protein
MMRIGFPMIITAVLLSGCAAAPSGMPSKYEASEQARLDKDLEGYTAGKPQNCVDLRDLGGPESYGESVLVFRSGRGLLYKNQVSGSCNNVGRHEALITRPFGSQLCRGDIARTADLSAGMTTGSCSLGEFVPYRKPKKQG